jgi:hypothetical protein
MKIAAAGEREGTGGKGNTRILSSSSTSFTKSSSSYYYDNFVNSTTLRLWLE